MSYSSEEKGSLAVGSQGMPLSHTHNFSGLDPSSL